MENVTSHSVAENPDAVARRLLLRAHNLDGLPEMAAGLTLLAAAGLIETQVMFPRGSIERKLAFLALVLVFLVMRFGARRAIKWLRRRYLVERVGYVEPNPGNWKRMAVISIIAAVVGALVALAASRRLFPIGSWVTGEWGILLAAIAVIYGRSQRFVIGGVLVVVAGIWISAQGVALDQGLAMIFGFAGSLAAVSGFVVFILLMRQAESGE